MGAIKDGSLSGAPDRLFVFSDMQFDQAMPDGHSAFNKVRAAYDLAGVKMPQIVFWNLAAKEKTALPITINDQGVALVSGFSSRLLQLFLDEVPLDPLTIVNQALSVYKVVVLDTDVSSTSTSKEINWNAVNRALKHPKSALQATAEAVGSSDDE